MKKGKVTIAQILIGSDKAEFIEWVKENIGQAEKCLIMIGIPDGKGGLNLRGRQIGFDYLYELQGFSEWVAESFEDYEDEDCK